MQTLFMLSDPQWDEIKTIFEPKERKRKVSLRIIVSGIVYLLHNGCKWESLPPLYGNSKNVWYYYNKWMVFGVLEQALDNLSRQLRQAQGRNPEPTLGIVDSQTAKTTAGSSEETGYDGGKKLKGRKRHLGVDTEGNILAVGVTAASVHDKPGALSIKEQMEDHGKLKKIVADGAYRGMPPFTAGGRIAWQVVERKATGGRFKVLPKRWVVERTFAWLSSFRRLSKDYEKTVVMSKAMILMCAICITLNKLSTYF